MDFKCYLVGIQNLLDFFFELVKVFSRTKASDKSRPMKVGQNFLIFVKKQKLEQIKKMHFLKEFKANSILVVFELVARSLEQDSKSIWPHLVQL